MLVYPYKTQVYIVVVSMTLHNYIRKRLQGDVAFAKYNCNSNFVPDDFLPDVVAHSDSQGSQRPSCMDFVCNEIANSLIGQ
jgi:hypothetical protein